MLYKSLSPLRFSDLLYYGFFGSHRYILKYKNWRATLKK